MDQEGVGFPGLCRTSTEVQNQTGQSQEVRLQGRGNSDSPGPGPGPGPAHFSFTTGPKSLRTRLNPGPTAPDPARVPPPPGPAPHSGSADLIKRPHFRGPGPGLVPPPQHGGDDPVQAPGRSWVGHLGQRQRAQSPWQRELWPAQRNREEQEVAETGSTAAPAVETAERLIQFRTTILLLCE